MNEDENNRTVRFFQWVDDEGRYSKNSIYARLIQRQTRIIRNVDNEEPLDEETIGDKKTSSEVRVKWFVPCNGQHYRFPARISPNFKIKNKDECYDYLKRSNIPNTAKRAKILKNYRKNPDIFKKKLATEMNRISGLIATNKSIKGNSTSATDIMKIEVKDLEIKINSVNGLTNSIIENIRLKHNQVTQRFREQRLSANIVFADTCE